MTKEEKAIILDYLPYGYPLEKKMMPMAQAIGKNQFTLLQLVPRRGINLKLKQEVYIGEDKRPEIYYILGRLPVEKLTEIAKEQLREFIENIVTENKEKFIDFFNKAEAINTRVHQFELLPGFGKKHTEAILEERNKKPFKDLEDLKNRVSNLPDPHKAIEKRFFEEITEKQRYYLFMEM